MLFAGTIADIDLLSLLFGPSAYLAAHRTYTHSLVGTVAVIALAVFFVRLLARKHPESITALLLPLAVAAVLHIVLDLFQSEGVALLWPFHPSRFAMNWLPPLDPWILALLLAGVLVPELLRLVSSEIGAKNKSPRGRNGALVALALVLTLIGMRALLHSSSIASLDPHSYRSESARRVGAFPDAFSLLTWHGVVETQSLLCLVDVPVGPGRTFDPEKAECFHKPQPSPELDAAQKTHVAQAYIQIIPFPRAIVAKAEEGYEVVILSMRDLAERELRHRVAARILLNSKFAISSQDLVWDSDIHLR
jgi:inner membrane protein